MEVIDFVHGKITIPADICKIIETPHFQRLKHIKQLGCLYLVIPDATYTRYEHSIGTYFIASNMLTCLEKNSNFFKNISVNKTDLQQYKFYRKACELAAILHDIGHGPLSHFWECIAVDYNHEENANDCVDNIFESLQGDVLPEFRDNNNFGIELVKALISGESSWVSSFSCFQTKYNFLFEIVHNKQCELDVDKLDYLKHDFFFAKFALDGFKDLDNELDSIFYEARISENGEHIEYRYEDYEKIYKLFEARQRLHHKFYRMPKVMACETLLKKIIQTGDYSIDGVSVLKIRSCSTETFLKTVDNEIMRLISNHMYFPYLKNTARIVQIDKSEFNLDDPLMLEIKSTVQGAGVYMPPDNQFHFYGQSELKAPIKRDLCKKVIYACYRLL